MLYSVVVSLALAASTAPSADASRIRSETTAGADSVLIVRGKEIVTTVCAACHTEQPPEKLAPPLAHVSRRYRMMITHRDSALRRIAAWIKAPSREHSLMPAMAIERFGMMAPLPLPEDQRLAAAAYVWFLSEGASTPGAMRGMDGMRHDTTSGMRHDRAGHDSVPRKPVPPPRSRSSMVP